MINHLKTAGAVLLTVVCLCSCAYILYSHTKDTSLSSTDGTFTISSVAPSSTTASTPDSSTPEGQIWHSFQDMLAQPAIRVKNNTTLHLKGKLIHGTRYIASDIHLRDADNESMQMQMRTKTTEKKHSETSNAYYTDGWYLTDTPDESFRIAKTPERVLSFVSFLSGILTDASDDLQDMQVSQKNQTTIYRFTMPPELASMYFDQIIAQASMDTPELKHVTGEVSSIRLTCTVSDKTGLLIRQQAKLTGTVSKSIFTIPASLNADTSFNAEPKDRPLSLPDPEDYPIRKESDTP